MYCNVVVVVVGGAGLR